MRCFRPNSGDSDDNFIIRLYELIPLEGKEMFGYFLALRAITQKPLEYFLEHQEMLGIFIDLDEPMNVEQEAVYEDADYSNLMNLVTHINETQESLSLKNSVISIFFLRFLQHGKYFQKHVPERRANDRKLDPKEKFILKLINHLIAVQCFNHQQVTELAIIKKQYKWEVIGASLHPSLSLVNHSCEPNTFNFNINQTSILIANRHIHQGEEITMSYDGVDYRTMKREQREYRLLKNYMFQCECRACVEKWGLKDQIPDELARIPNFEQERCFVVRFGDKKDICDEINGARWMADYGIASNTFTVAQEALDHLSLCLTKHVVKPHLHFVEASEMAELFAINQYCRMPVEIVDEEEEKEKKAEVYDCEMEVDQYSKKKKSDVQNPVIEKASEPDGTSKLIKSFENSSETNGLATHQKERSPTLRMFASLNDEDVNGKGPRKKSVLDRIEDKFNPEARSNKQTKSVNDKAKRELADSMRRFSKREEMAERMSAFQPKKLLPKSWIDKDKPPPKEMKEESPPVKENVDNNIIEDESKAEKQNKNSVIYEFLDTIKDKVSGVKEIKTDEQINDEISKMIENHRKKIREERNARKNKENRPHKLPLEPQYENLETKNTECKREIVKREEKLTKMIESSNERDKLLKARESEIQILREKTKRMLEEAKRKNDEFEDVEKNFFKSSSKSVITDKSEPKKSVKKGKSGQKSSKSMMKQEIKSKAPSSDDDKDLLAFLRQSHKKKGNIYDFIDPSKPKSFDPPIVRVNGSDLQSDRNNNISANCLNLTELKDNIPITFKDQTASCQKVKGAKTISNKKNFIEDRWEDIKKKEAEEEKNKKIEEVKKLETERLKKIQAKEEEAELSSAESMAEEVVLKSSSVNDDSEFEQITVNGKHWAAQLEETINSIEQISRPKNVEEKVVIQKSSSSETRMTNSISPVQRKEKSLTPQPPSSDDTDMRHYSHRWSDRNTLSPSPCPEERKVTRLRKRGRYSMRNISVDSDSDDNAPLPVALPVPLPKRMTTVEKPPRPGRLSRRKSLSEDCLKTSKKSDVDAFGLPKISIHNKRSVSLIRDSFASPKEIKENPEKIEGKKRSITKETRTSNASEFKNKFEAGSVSNLTLINRSATPYKPPKVDKCHLNKVKNKFSDTSEKLPFPNYKPIPPKPSCKPPPPPPL